MLANINKTSWIKERNPKNSLRLKFDVLRFSWLGTNFLLPRVFGLGFFLIIFNQQMTKVSSKDCFVPDEINSYKEYVATKCVLSGMYVLRDDDLRHNEPQNRLGLGRYTLNLFVWIACIGIFTGVSLVEKSILKEYFEGLKMVLSVTRGISEIKTTDRVQLEKMANLQLSVLREVRRSVALFKVEYALARLISIAACCFAIFLLYDPNYMTAENFFPTLWRLYSNRVLCEIVDQVANFPQGHPTNVNKYTVECVLGDNNVNVYSAIAAVGLLVFMIGVNVYDGVSALFISPRAIDGIFLFLRMSADRLLIGTLFDYHTLHAMPNRKVASAY